MPKAEKKIPLYIAKRNNPKSEDDYKEFIYVWNK